VAAADGPPTRSRIEAFDQTADVLSGLAERLRAGGPVLRQAADVYVEQINAPNGTAWKGDAARRFLQEAQPDQESVNRAVEHADAMADAAERGGDYLRGARESTLEAITRAEEDDFTVSEDLSVTDKYLWESPVDQVARQRAALAHRDFIAHWATRLEAANTSIAAQLNAGVAEMTAITPAHWRQPTVGSGPPAERDDDTNTTSGHRGKVQAAGHGWKQDPTWEPDPANMTPEEARDAYNGLKDDIRAHNASPPNPSDQAAVDAYNVRADVLNARKAALEARLNVEEVVPAGKQRLVPDWAQPLPPRISEVPLQTDRGQLEKKYDQHAKDFGVTDPRGRVGFSNFDATLKEVVADPGTMHIQGTYHGEPAILNYNPQSGLCVVQTPDGKFWTGFKLSGAQASNVVNRGSLGGGDV
jgi:Colicin D